MNSVREVKDTLDGMEEYLERKILVGMLFHSGFLRQIKKHCGSKGASLFSEHLGIIAGWCFKFYTKYNKAPDKEVDLRLLYEDGAKKIMDVDKKEILSGLLESLTEQYELHPEEWTDKGCIAHLLDSATKYLKVKRYMVAAEELGDNLKVLDIDESLQLCEKTIGSMTVTDTFDTERVCIPTNIELIEQALEKETKPIFTLPGDLGKVVNGQFVEGGFVSILAPEKRGKSWMLMEIALQASKKGVPTVFIQAGDMNDKDMTARISVRISKKSYRSQYCGEIAIPVLDCANNQDNSCTRRERTCIEGVEGGKVQSTKRAKKSENEVRSASPIKRVRENPNYVPCTECRKDKDGEFIGAYWWTIRPSVDPLTSEEAKKNLAHIYKRWKCFPELLTRPAGSLTVSVIRSYLKDWEVYENYVPKVIVIDYMDLLVTEKFGPKDFRHGQNEIWKDIRGLAQEKNCLIVSATQADAASYDKHLLGIENFSEDKRKAGHVTAMWGLNQTFEEKRNGIMRVNQIVARNDAFNSQDTVTVLQNIETGQPLINSFMSR
jgi:hypothetical protein